MPSSTLGAAGSIYPLAESDPQGLESTTEVDLGLEIPSRDGAARASVGLWAVTLPCTPQGRIFPCIAHPVCRC